MGPVLHTTTILQQHEDTCYYLPGWSTNSKGLPTTSRFDIVRSLARHHLILWASKLKKPQPYRPTPVCQATSLGGRIALRPTQQRYLAEVHYAINELPLPVIHHQTNSILLTSGSLVHAVTFGFYFGRQACLVARHYSSLYLAVSRVTQTRAFLFSPFFFCFVVVVFLVSFRPPPN